MLSIPTSAFVVLEFLCVEFAKFVIPVPPFAAPKVPVPSDA